MICSSTNITLRDLTITGRPHMAVTNILGHTNITGTDVFYDLGQLEYGTPNDLNASVINGAYTGYSTALYGTIIPRNVLITNCQFLHDGVNSIGLIVRLAT